MCLCVYPLLKLLSSFCPLGYFLMAPHLQILCKREIGSRAMCVCVYVVVVVVVVVVVLLIGVALFVIIIA